MRELRWRINLALRCTWTFWRAARIITKMERDRMRTIRLKTMGARKQREIMVAQ
jgi:hypothetical protein